MCGRYVRKSDKQRLAEAFTNGKLPPDFILPPDDYNVAPTTMQPVVRLNHETSERELVLMRWGLIPFYAEDAKSAFKGTNARAEGITTNKMFREPFKRRHCLVPADLFYEWENLDPSDAKRKNTQPYAIGLKDDTPMAFAGLWDSWKDKANGHYLETFTIITTDPNGLMETIHNRMPVILPRSAYDRWLAPVDPARPPPPSTSCDPTMPTR
jgi:putative SOS response-associated peptidase YedK